jgi:hypothetical protein
MAPRARTAVVSPADLQQQSATCLLKGKVQQTAGGTRRIEDARFTPAKWRGRLCGIAKRVFHRVEPRASQDRILRCVLIVAIPKRGAALAL